MQALPLTLPEQQPDPVLGDLVRVVAEPQAQGGQWQLDQPA
jgi:hypothetical protein